MAEAGLIDDAKTTFAATEAMIAGFSRTKQIYALNRLIYWQRAAGLDREAKASFARALQIAMAIEITLPDLGDGSLNAAIDFQQKVQGDYDLASFLVAASEELMEDGEPAKARAALTRAMEHALTGGHLYGTAESLMEIALVLHEFDQRNPQTAP